MTGSTKERNGETAYVVKIVIVKIVIIPPPLCTCLERGRTKGRKKVYVNIFLIYNIIYIIIYILYYILNGDGCVGQGYFDNLDNDNLDNVRLSERQKRRLHEWIFLV